jgi:hypothetical protein
LGKKKNRGKDRGPRHTPFAKLKKRGSTLIAPLSELHMQTLSWDRDLLPEHIWIASLAVACGVDAFHRAYDRFMDALNEFWPTNRKEVCLGLITDFAAFSPEAQAGFLSKHRELARSLFWDPIGEALALYPENQAKWLTDGLREAGYWAYHAARDYAERYDPHYGTGLIPESAPMVKAIVGFWCEYYGVEI